MMRAQKKPLSGSVRTAVREVPLQDSSEGDAPDFGFEDKGKFLGAGYGAEALPLTLPQGQQAQAVYALDGAEGRAYCLVSADGKVWYCAAGGSEFTDSGVQFAARPAACRVSGGEAGWLLSDGTSVALFTADGVGAEAEIPAFSCACWHYERLWLVPASDAEQLYFSAPGALRDFSSAIGGGGYVRVPDEKGDICTLVGRENYLYLFRERGVQRLSARGDEAEFEVRDEFSCARVYAETVCETGGCIYWLGEDGLHRFDGGKEENFADTCRFFSETQLSPFAVAAAGMYTLHARICTEGGEEEAFVLIHPLRGDRQVVRASASFASACGGEVIFASDAGLFRLQKGAAPSRRIVRRLENPLAQPSCLSEVVLYGKGMYVIRFSGERGTRIVRLNAAFGSARAAVNLAGGQFLCELLSEGPACELRALTVRYTKGGLQ